MNGFSTETAVCLHYSVFAGVANAFYAQVIDMINYRSLYRGVYKIIRISGVDPHIFRSDMSSGTTETFLFAGRCIVIALQAKNLPSNMADGQMVPISLL